MTAHRISRAFALGPIPYHSFGLSRALALAGVRTVNGQDWWSIGVQAILPAQQSDGSWYFDPAGKVDVLETCWHLLFLTRAAVPAAPLP